MAIITVTKTIGATSRNFSTPQTWEDAAPTNLVTAEKSAAGTFVGTFTLGESLTFVGSGATGKFLDSDGATYVIYGIATGNPAASDVVTGGSSGGTCILSSSTPTDVGVIWKGECYNDSEFVVTANFARVLFVAGETTDSTHYLELTAAAGQSFQDHASVRTNPLTYDVTKGVGLRCAGTYTNAVVDVDTNIAFRMSRLQLKHNASSYNKPAIGIGNDQAIYPVIVKDCILVTKASCGGGHAIWTIINCVIIQMVDISALTHKGSGGDSTAIGCTFVYPSNLAASTHGAVTTPYNTSALNLTSCAIFGFNSLCDTVAPFVGVNCATNLASGFTAGSSGNQVSVTYNSTSPFTQASSASTLDFSAVASTALDNNGSLDSTNAPNDITGTARDASPTIGVWEIVGAAATKAFTRFNRSLRFFSRKF